MRCERHGESGEPVEGQCRLCLKERVIAEVTEIARGGGETLSDFTGKPFTYVPKLDIWPRDFPRLQDGSLGPRRAEVIRQLLAQTYVRAAQVALANGSPVLALTYLGSASSYEPQEHRIQWNIHYETALALREILRARGEFGRQGMSSGSIRSLAAVAAHLVVGLEHAMQAAIEPANAPSRGETSKAGGEATRVEQARRLLREILDMGYFVVDGDSIRGPEPIYDGPIERYLFPSVPRGPQAN